MVIRGEVPDDALKPIRCEHCNIDMYLMVCCSAGGYYLGRMCCCGPHSRSTGYYKTFDEAEKAMVTQDATWRQ